MTASHAPATAHHQVQPPTRSAHRATLGDRLAIILLGMAGCVLSYDSLRQMATADHIRPTLTYLFPVVIDGFVAYSVRALLFLREAPRRARLYASGLFITATGASIWANCLHARDLNQPGMVNLHLDDTTVIVLSAIAPLALAGATHLHILITRYSGTASQPPVPATSAGAPGSTQPLSAQAAEVPYTAPAASPAHPRPADPNTRVTTVDAASASVDETRPEAEYADQQDPDGSEGEPAEEHDRAGQDPQGDSGQPPTTSMGGRPALASIAELADVIESAHSSGSGLTRDSARKAITDAGLGAGTERLTEAMSLVRQRAEARQHPAS